MKTNEAIKLLEDRLAFLIEQSIIYAESRENAENDAQRVNANQSYLDMSSRATECAISLKVIRSIKNKF